MEQNVEEAKKNSHKSAHDLWLLESFFIRDIELSRQKPQR